MRGAPKNSKNPSKVPSVAQSRMTDTHLQGLTSKKTSNQQSSSIKNRHYLSLTNEEYLVRNLRLIGITDQ